MILQRSIPFLSIIGFAFCSMKMPPQPPQKGGNNGNMANMMMMAPPIRILRMKSVSDVDGNYNYMYESENGIRMQEQGFVKQGEKKEDHINVAQGSYSYTSPEGMSFTVNYIADENGFQVLDNDDMNDDGQQQQMKQPPPKQQQQPMTTTRPPPPPPPADNGKSPYINEHILRLGTTQNFYRFFNKPQQDEEAEDETTDQYENY